MNSLIVIYNKKQQKDLCYYRNLS